MNRKHGPRFFMTLLLFAVVFSCGVNTGNPTTQQIKIGKTGSSILLSIKQLASGKLRLKVNSALLVLQGETVSSSHTVTLSYAQNTSFFSGQTVSLASSSSIPAGTYDRIVLVLDPTEPATLIDNSSQESPIAIAPYSYYGRDPMDTATNQVQVVFSLSSGGTEISADGNQNVQLETDLASNVKAFDTIVPAAYDYYKGIGKLDFQYTLEPQGSIQIVTEEAPGKAQLNVVVHQDPLPIQFICIYKQSEVTDPTIYINDLSCAGASYYAEIARSASTETGFSLASDTYIVLGRNPDLALVYQQTIELPTDSRKTLDLTTGAVTEE